jgi:hypothetical protein
MTLGEQDMTAIGGESKFSENVIEKGLQELKELYDHDYGQPMPELRPGAGFADEREIERLGRLVGVVLKSPVANAVAIDPANSNTASHFAYEFDLSKLEAPEFAGSEHGKIFAALLEQTKFMMDEGVPPEIAGQIIERTYALPPDKRAADFAKELAYEGRTFRALLRAVRFVTCNPAIRGAFTVVVASGAGTTSSTAAAASFLAVHVPWVALYPPAMVAGVVGLIIVMGVDLTAGSSVGRSGGRLRIRARPGQRQLSAYIGRRLTLVAGVVTRRGRDVVSVEWLKPPCHTLLIGLRHKFYSAAFLFVNHAS